MGKFKIQAGDFNKTHAGNTYMLGQFVLYPDAMEAAKQAKSDGKGFFKQMFAGAKSVSYKLPDDIEDLELASEDSVKKIGGTVGWGAAGAVMLGPAGLLAGLLLGGKGKEITFVCKFKDGRKMMATVDKKTWAKIQAKMF